MVAMPWPCEGRLDPCEEPDWDSPAVRGQLIWLREVGRVALKLATSRREWRVLEKFYSDKGLRKRIRLLRHPAVARALEVVWQATASDASVSVVRDEFMVMHRKLVLAIKPHTAPQEAFREALSEWHKGSHGETGLTKMGLSKQRFFWSWIELVDQLHIDVWCDRYDDTQAEQSYAAELMLQLAVDITAVDKDGIALIDSMRGTSKPTRSCASGRENACSCTGCRFEKMAM